MFSKRIPKVGDIWVDRGENIYVKVTNTNEFKDLSPNRIQYKIIYLTESFGLWHIGKELETTLPSFRAIYDYATKKDLKDLEIREIIE